MNIKEYKVTINTEESSWKFGRYLTAYVTGLVGDTYVGEEEKNIFIKEEGYFTRRWFIKNIIPQYNDIDCVTLDYFKICSNSRWFNDGWGNDYYIGNLNKDEVLKHLQEKIKSYRKANPNWPFYFKHEIPESFEEIKKFQSYLSIEFYFKKEPSHKIKEVIYNRSHNFCKDKRISENYKPGKITLIEYTIKE